MNKKDLIKWGSETAWLAIMDYPIKEIDKSDKEFQKIYTKGEK